MPNVRVPFLRLPSWPLEGVLATFGLFGAGVAVGLGLGGVVSPLIGGLAAGCGIALAILIWKSQATAARLANQLCRDDGVPRRSLVDALKRISAQLDVHERRAANIHPITGLPTREHLAEQIAVDLRAPQGQMLLGGLRFTDFDRLAAFDLPAANSALAAFAKRLVAAAKANHIVGQIDRDCIAIWFRASADPAAAAAEFRALAYVASQPLPQGASSFAHRRSRRRHLPRRRRRRRASVRPPDGGAEPRRTFIGRRGATDHTAVDKGRPRTIHARTGPHPGHR